MNEKIDSLLHAFKIIVKGGVVSLEKLNAECKCGYKESFNTISILLGDGIIKESTDGMFVCSATPKELEDFELKRFPPERKKTAQPIVAKKRTFSDSIEQKAERKNRELHLLILKYAIEEKDLTMSTIVKRHDVTPDTVAITLRRLSIMRMIKNDNGIIKCNLPLEDVEILLDAVRNYPFFNAWMLALQRLRDGLSDKCKVTFSYEGKSIRYTVDPRLTPAQIKEILFNDSDGVIDHLISMSSYFSILADGLDTIGLQVRDGEKWTPLDDDTVILESPIGAVFKRNAYLDEPTEIELFVKL